jgi:hypothetical protein
VVAVVVTNAYLFTRAIPRHRPRGSAVSPTVGYVATDFAGALCWQAAGSLPPILVLDLLGAAASAYFSVAWLIGYGLYQLAINMGYSLMVESADERTLPAHYRRIMRNTGALLVVAVLALVLGAPRLLRVFGPEYAAHGTTALRLLALSALPNLVLSTAVAVCRVRRRLRVPVTALTVLAALVVGLTVLLVPRWGIVGAAAAWLVAQSVVAAGLLAFASTWRPARETPGETMATPSPLTRLRGLLPLAPPRRLLRPADRLTARRLAARVRPGVRPLGVERTDSDLLVVHLDGAGGPVAVKHPRTGQAAAALAAECEVLTRLAADERLGGLRALLPPVTDQRLDGPLPLAVAGWLPGTDGERLLHREPGRAQALAVGSLGAIDELHRATGRVEPVDTLLADWVDRPVEVLAAALPCCRTAEGAAGLRAVRQRLHRGLPERRMLVAWTHGDFHPGNVLVDPRLRVTGLIDWSNAAQRGPADVDAYLFVLALHRLLDRREIGVQAAALAAGADPGPVDRALLAVTGTPVTPEGALLTWLWHIAGNVTKCGRFARSHWWAAGNVLPVLAEARRWPDIRP